MSANQRNNILQFLVENNRDKYVIPELQVPVPIVFFCEEKCKIYEINRYRKVGWCLN